MKFAAFEAIQLKNPTATIDVIELSLSLIVCDKNQPRKNFTQQALGELAASIKEYGILQPIIVRSIHQGQYQITAGERRWRAAKIAGLTTIPAIIQNNIEQKNFAISLIENIQREELNAIELAHAFYRLNAEYDLSHESIAMMVGKSRVTVTNFLRLLNLSQKVQDLLIATKLEMGHAKALLTLPFEKQELLAQKVVEKNLSVRETEKLAQHSKSFTNIKPRPYKEEVECWKKKLSTHFLSKVEIKINDKGQGKMIIPFGSPIEVDRFVQKLLEEKAIK
jgi:ParB family chromosome partitioning protein